MRLIPSSPRLLPKTIRRSLITRAVAMRQVRACGRDRRLEIVDQQYLRQVVTCLLQGYRLVALLDYPFERSIFRTESRHHQLRGR